MSTKFPLGRRVPPDFEHVQKYSLASVEPVIPKFTVEKSLILPPWHTTHDQGNEGACVGFGTSMMLAILNTQQCLLQGLANPYIHYNPWWLWDRAKEIDPFPDTNPGDSNGTLVRSACEVLRTVGPARWENEKEVKSFTPLSVDAGIKTYRWATSIDEVRYALYTNNPVSIGVNWYSNFDKPVYKNGEYWIGTVTNLGRIRGGHCVCIYGASDQRQAVRIKNSWGTAYPEVWMPYKVLARLIKEQGEVALITDF